MSVTTYLTPQCLEKGHTRMARDLTDESALLVKVHPVEVRVIAGEDLIGFWDDPDLNAGVNLCSLSRVVLFDVPRSFHLQ